MKKRTFAYWISGLATVALSGCYFPSTDFVRIEPVRYVPPPSETKPNAEFGWVNANRTEAQRYLVTVGDNTYQRVIEPYKKGGEITFTAAVDAFAIFAEKQVEDMNYCKSAYVPDDARKLIGGKTPPEMRIYVECTEK